MLKALTHISTSPAAGMAAYTPTSNDLKQLDEKQTTEAWEEIPPSQRLLLAGPTTAYTMEGCGILFIWSDGFHSFASGTALTDIYHKIMIGDPRPVARVRVIATELAISYAEATPSLISALIKKVLKKALDDNVRKIIENEYLSTIMLLSEECQTNYVFQVLALLIGHTVTKQHASSKFKFFGMGREAGEFLMYFRSLENQEVWGYHSKEINAGSLIESGIEFDQGDLPVLRLLDYKGLQLW
jgi:hypothetical protein